MVTGGNKFALTMGEDTALGSTCASSLIAGDLSNYWIPHLYFQSPENKTLYSVDMFYMNVYYFFEATDDEIVAFPPGFRMTSGDPMLRSPPATGGRSILDPAQGPIQPIQITCPLNDDKSARWPANSDGMHGVGIQDPQNAGSGVGFPNQDCDGYASPMRLDIHFPSCYNPAAALDDYKHNTAWPSSTGAKNGQNCPEGWLHVPHIFYEVYYNTPEFKDYWTQGGSSQPFVLAMGDSTGYGLHGDFIAGWNTTTLQAIIDTCDAGDSGMDQCPDIPGGLVSSDEASACTIPAANPSEQVLGELGTDLPGCNPIVGAGANANTAATCPGRSSAVTPPYAPSLPAVSSGAAVATPAPTSVASSIATPSIDASISTQPPFMASSMYSSSAPSASALAAPTSPVASVSAAGASSSAVGSASTPVPSSGNSSAPQGWTSLGCFADDKSQRVLPGPTTNLLQTMTISQCTDFCQQNGYEYAGLEYKSECYCGHDAPTEQSNACTDPCAGDASTMCGGWNAINVYHASDSQKRDVHEHARRHRRHAKETP